MEKIGEKYIQLYDAGDGFVVEIHLDGTEWGAWLYKNGYGVKSFMFGTSCKQLADVADDGVFFIDLVERSLAEYKRIYNEEYGE